MKHWFQVVSLTPTERPTCNETAIKSTAGRRAEQGKIPDRAAGARSGVMQLRGLEIGHTSKETQFVGRRLALGALAEHHGSATVEGPRGNRERCLSTALLEMLDGRPRHGYELYDVLVSSGFRMGDRALVYHELHVLERTDLVVSHLDVSSPGPARRVYAVTTAGHQLLSRTRRQRASNDRAVDV